MVCTSCQREILSGRQTWLGGELVCDICAELEGERETFREKIRTVNFGRVPGGGRD